MLLEVLILPAYAHALWAVHLLMDAGETQATLLIRNHSSVGLLDIGVYVCTEIALELRLVIGYGIQVNHHESYGKTHLRSCQAHTLGFLKRLKHILNELRQSLIAAVNLLGLFLQDTLSIRVDW